MQTPALGKAKNLQDNFQRKIVEENDAKGETFVIVRL